MEGGYSQSPGCCYHHYQLIIIGIVTIIIAIIIDIIIIRIIPFLIITIIDDLVTLPLCGVTVRNDAAQLLDHLLAMEKMVMIMMMMMIMPMKKKEKVNENGDDEDDDDDKFKRVLSVSLTSSRQSCSFTKVFYIYFLTTCFDDWRPVHVVVFNRQTKHHNKLLTRNLLAPRK